MYDDDDRGDDYPGETLGSRLQREYDEWVNTDRGRLIKEEARRMALDLWRSGRNHYGIGAIIEVFRYHTHLRSGDAGTFKINSKFKSRLARTIMAETPELENFFETRELRS